MTKPDWKTKPHERKRMTLQQENQALKERIQTMLEDNDQTIRALNNYKEQAAINEKFADRYLVLKNKEVMVLDGEPKYLKGKDLDDYCDAETHKVWGLSLQNMIHRINSSNPASVKPNKILINPSMWAAAQKILKEQRDGNGGMITPEP